MLTFSFIILFLFLLSSCISEVKNDESESELHPIPEVCCIQSDISQLAEADSVKNTRGWEGSVGPFDQFPSVQYPLNTIYLMVENRDAAEGWDVMPIPIHQDDFKRYIELCFKADEFDRYKIYAMSEGQKIQIGPNKECFFSSIPNIKTSLQKSPSIKTPGGKETYEPYGDKLFRSESIYFEYNKKSNTIMRQWDSDRRPKPLTDLKSIYMYRGTSVIIPRLVICDDYPKWVEGQPIPTGDSELTEAKFIECLDSVKYWDVRFFLAGNKDGAYPDGSNDNDFPTDLYIDVFSQRGAQVQVGETGWDNKGVVAMTQNIMDMQPISHTLANNETGEGYTYKGFGVHDGSFPFIYGMEDGFDLIDMCCCLYYDNPTTGEKKSLTVRFPMADMDLYRLSVNYIHTITYVIDVDDVKAAFFPTPAQKASRSIRYQKDYTFGQTVDIPAVRIKSTPVRIPDTTNNE